MSVTAELARYTSSLELEAIPEDVLSQARLVALDAIGNAIGGAPFGLAESFRTVALVGDHEI